MCLEPSRHSVKKNKHQFETYCVSSYNSFNPHTTLFNRYYGYPHFTNDKLRCIEVKYLAQGPTNSKLCAWDLIWEGLTPKAVLFMTPWSLLNTPRLVNWVSGALTFRDRILHLLIPGIFQAKLLKVFLRFLILLLELPHLVSKLVIPPIPCPLHILFFFFHNTCHHLPWFIFAFTCHPWLEYSLLSLVYCLVFSKEVPAWHQGDAQYRYTFT